MKLYRLLGLFYFTGTILFNINELSANSIQVQEGILDLSKENLSKDFIFKLNGDWEFYWKKFIASDHVINPSKPDSYMNIPIRWNHNNTNNFSTKGYASYRMKIFFPEEAIGKTISFRMNNMANNYRLFIQRKMIAEVGKPETSKDKSIPLYRKIIRSVPISSAEMEIIIEISNFYDSTTGGFWKSISMGTEEKIQNEREKSLSFDLFLLGSLVIMSFYHLGLFLLRKEDRSSLAFSIFTFLIAVRIIFTGELLSSLMFPDLSWQWHEKIEFLSFYLSVPVFFVFLHSLFPQEFPKIMGYIVFLIASSFSIDILIHPLEKYALRLIYFQIFTLVAILYIVVMMTIAIIRRKEGAFIFSMGLFFFFAAVIFDIYMSQFGTSEFITPLGLFIFIFSQSFILSLLFSRAYQSVQILSNRLKTTNKAFSRFVPQNILSLLNKEDITAIELGEQIQIEMPVLFSDIRDFTGLSETMTPEENFNFLNSYLKRIGPIVRKNKGFIDKYLGDGIMALFPGGNINPLDCALEILEEVKIYNVHRKKMNYSPIEIGIAIHRGDLMLGTIGESERMDATVISDTVNTASRIESLNKIFGTHLIISHDYFNLLSENTEADFRRLGKIKVKGKKETTVIYEVFSSDEEKIREKKKINKDRYHLAMDYYFKREFHNARKLFDEISNDFPEDKTSAYYSERSLFYMEHEDLWQEAEIVSDK